MARIQELSLSRGNRGLLLLAVAAGLVAAVLVFVALAQDDGGSGTTTTSAVASKAVVARQNIKAGTTITAEMVGIIDVPQDLVVPGAFADSTLVVGEQARFPIARGDILSPSKVGVEVRGEGLKYVVPAGKRGMSVEVREVTAVGGLLLAGDRVDLIVSFVRENDTQSPEDDQVVIMTILRDIEVLAVAQTAQEAVPVSESATDPEAADASALSTSGQLPEENEEQPRAVSVTLALDPIQTELVACVQDFGGSERVWAALRPFGEPAPAVTMEVPRECIID